MFVGRTAIEPLVELLDARQSSLWHACQWRDFQSYVALGGIPSRRLLERRHLSFTPFVSDSRDRSNRVWGKVFLNLDDFGRVFAQGAAATPNAYGPIAIQLRPDVLLAADDVAICLRSAGARDFDRDGEALDTVADADRLFMNPASVGFPHSTDIRFGEKLEAEFGWSGLLARTPEVSLTVPGDLLSLDHAVAIWIDPVLVGDISLLDLVRGAMSAAPTPVRARSIGGNRQQTYAELLEIVGDDGPPSVRLVLGRGDISESTRAWADKLIDRDLEWQYQRFATYLREGTLGEIASGAPVPERSRPGALQPAQPGSLTRT